MRKIQQRRLCILALAAGGFLPALALDPGKALTQYSMAVWTQQQGLPQDSVRAIAQTTDGYLWLGTDEGLARFDGYEFVTFSRDHGDLPSNSISSLAADKDGSLWIGTRDGLTHYRDRHFRNYSRRDGMPGNSIDSLFEDRAGVLWIVAEGSLSRFDGTRFTNFEPDRDLAMTKARSVAQDNSGNIYVAGWSSVARLENGKFVTVVTPSTLDKDFPICMQIDRGGTLWILGTHELTAQSPHGAIRRYGVDNSLAGFFGLNGALQLDRNGNVWMGAVGGLARVQGGSVRRLAAPGLVRSIFEDRDGNLWVGTNGGLIRLHDDLFAVYGKAEGLPSDEPNAVHPDRAGRVWMGFQDGGLVLLSGKVPAGIPTGSVFSINETRTGDLLIAGRAGLSRLHGGRFQTYIPPDPLARKSVYDVAEDTAGRIWLAMPHGLGVLEGNTIRYVITAAQSESGMYSVTGDNDGSVWAGSWNGLWHVTPHQASGNQVRRFGAADGLPGDHVRTIHRDARGTIWIGTFGGGLNELREGKFTSYSVKDGLLSDNVSDIIEDGESLWLSTTRGICRVFLRDLKNFAEHRVKKLTPVNYSVPDGLREGQGSAHPSGGGGRATDGSLWFVTGRGVAVLRPGARMPATASPQVHLVDMVADGHQLDWTKAPRVPPGSGRLQLRYAAIHLSAPERVRYSFKLEGLDADWVPAGLRRGVSYDNLRHGHYRFNVRAELPGVVPTVNSWEFEMLPHYYETVWFRVLCALMLAGLGWMMYEFRVRQIRSRFALVLQERARLAREIHDTLTQAFVGISSQLDVVESRMDNDIEGAHSSLELARRMSQHSLNEARRSVMDLRAVALEGHDLASALKSGSDLWVEGSGIAIDIDVKGEPRVLPEEVEHHVLRIAQEGVTNVLKHARASRIALKLRIDTSNLNLQVTDDGCGFNPDNVFASAKGHFGLIGMRERAERLGGELRLESHPGEGTQLDVTVPLV